MGDKHNDKPLTPSVSRVPTEIQLGTTSSVDLSFLSEDERKVLLMDYAKGMIDLSKKAHELHIDTAALKKTLDDLADTTNELSQSGNSVTITHTQTTKVGRTEVIMGNTDHASKGRLSASQTGEPNWTPYYIFAGILALIIIAALSR